MAPLIPQTHTGMSKWPHTPAGAAAEASLPLQVAAQSPVPPGRQWPLHGDTSSHADPHWSGRQWPHTSAGGQQRPPCPYRLQIEVIPGGCVVLYLPVVCAWMSMVQHLPEGSAVGWKKL